MHLEVAALTDRGRQRRNNEDAYLCRPDTGLFAVADGMGGHAAGEVASRLAVETLAAAFPERPAADLGEKLLAAVRVANSAIFDRSMTEPDMRGMGTTLTALLLAPDQPAWLVHIGDSRAYRLRDDALERLTTDHTWVQEELDAGRLTSEQAFRHPRGNIITRALGVDPVIDADLLRADVRPGDAILLCSDGLTGMLKDAEIEQFLHTARPVDDAAAGLVKAANERGGSDNITLILIRARTARSSS